MPYNNNQQGAGPNINTTLTTIFSPEAQLTVKAWNRLLSLEFAKAVGEPDENGLSQYDNDSSHHIRTSLTYEKCVALKKKYEEVLRPAILEGTPKSISVKIRTNTGERKLITLGFNGTAPFIRIGWQLAEDFTGTPDNFLDMTLRPVELIKDFNILSGESEPVEDIYVDLDKFVECLDSVGVKPLAVSHAIRFGNAVYSSYTNNRMSGNNAAYGRGGNGYGNNYGNNQYSNNNNGYQAPYRNNNAFMPADLNMGGDMNDTLPFN